MQEFTTAVAPVLGLVALVGGAAVAWRSSRAPRLVQAFAGGLIGALILFDLVPGSLDHGSAPLLTAAVCVTAFVLVRRLGVDGCCSGASASLAAAAIATHGLLEGAILGFSLGLSGALGIGLVLAFCLHKLCEGYAGVATLRAAAVSPVRIWSWVGVAALAPVIGSVIAAQLVVPERAVGLVMAALAGVLAAVAVALITPAFGRRDTSTVLATVGAGAALMTIATGMAG